jgi:uncharacterized protein YjbI with pentapeptide repeats
LLADASLRDARLSSTSLRGIFMIVDVSLHGVSLGGTLGLAGASLRCASLSGTLLLAGAFLRGVSLSGALLLADTSHICECMINIISTASKLGPHTQTDRGTCPSVRL